MPDPKPIACVGLPLEEELEARIAAASRMRRLSLRASRAETLEALADAEGALVSNQLRLDSELLDAAPKLRIVAGFGVGYDRFDIAEATKRGVIVCNTPDVLTGTVADLTLCLLFAVSRSLLAYADYARSGAWSRRERPPALGHDVKGKTLGIVGFGRIGREVTRRAQTLCMRTLWNDLFSELPAGAPESRYLPLDDLLRESDVVSLHTDLNPSSHHLIGERELALMKPTALLINTSRGPVVDQPALSAALRQGRPAAAALDVLEQEPPDAADPILSLPNVLVVPHIGTATEETRYAMRELAVRNLVCGLSGERPPTPVNPEVLG